MNFFSGEGHSPFPRPNPDRGGVSPASYPPPHTLSAPLSLRLWRSTWHHPNPHPGSGPDRQFIRTTDILSRQRLRSSTTNSLFVPAVRLSTVGRRDFPVAGACIMVRFIFGLPPRRLCLPFKQRLKCTHFVAERSHPVATLPCEY